MGMVASSCLGVAVRELVDVDGRQAGTTPADHPVHGCDRPSGSGGQRSSWYGTGRERRARARGRETCPYSVRW